MLEEVKQRYIIEQSEAVFRRFGYAKTTMADLAEASGMSRPALYLHFKNKEEVYRTVVKAYGDNAFEEIREAVSKAGSGIESRLWAVFEIWFIRTHALLYHPTASHDLLKEGLARCADIMQRSRERMENFLTELLQEAGKDEPHEWARFILMSGYGMKQFARDEEDLRKMLARLIAVL